MTKNESVLLSPVELAFLGAATVPSGDIAAVLLQQLGVPGLWIDDEAFQACGLQVLVARRLAVVGVGQVSLSTLVAQVAAVLSAPTSVVVLIAQAENGEVSGARVVDGGAGRISFAPVAPGLWRTSPLDSSVPLTEVVIEAATATLQNESVVVSLGDGRDLANEETIALRRGFDPAAANARLDALLAD